MNLRNRSMNSGASCGLPERPVRNHIRIYHTSRTLLLLRRIVSKLMISWNLPVPPFGLCRLITMYSAGKTNNVIKVDVNNPPKTTVASGRWISAPVPSKNNLGSSPNMATVAVIRIGRSRIAAPSRMAASNDLPDC